MYAYFYRNGIKVLEHKTANEDKNTLGNCIHSFGNVRSHLMEVFYQKIEFVFVNLSKSKWKSWDLVFFNLMSRIIDIIKLMNLKSRNIFYLRFFLFYRRPFVSVELKPHLKKVPRINIKHVNIKILDLKNELPDSSTINWYLLFCSKQFAS